VGTPEGFPSKHLITNVLTDTNWFCASWAAVVVQHILSREDNWNSWKNDSCPNFIRKSDDAKPKTPASTRYVTRSTFNRSSVPELLWLRTSTPKANLFVMVALCNRADHYIFMLWFVLSSFFLLSSFFFPRLISAV